MKRIILAFVLLLSLVPPIFAEASTSAPTLKLVVNNEEITTSPFISNGTTYVPLDAIAKRMGDEVTSTSYQQKVRIQGKSFIVIVKEGLTTGIVNGKLYPLKTKSVDGQQVNADVKALYKNDQIFVPVEFIASGNGLTYPVETVNNTIYIGKLPTEIQTEINNKSITLKVNNKQVSSKVNPFVSEGTTYVPLNEIAKQMGGEASSSASKVVVELSGLKFATVKVGGTTAEMYDSQKMSRDRTHYVPLKTKKVNGNKIKVNAKAISKNGQLFVPIEFLSNLDYEVETVKRKTTTIYIGSLPSSLQETVNKHGHGVKWAVVHPSPGSIDNTTSIIKDQQFFIYGAQGNWYKVKVGK